LDFHHVGEKKLKMNKARTMRSMLAELPFCVVMCANCHRKLHARETEDEPQMGFEL
jgi:predicted HNH restriction endonuclease